MTVDIPEDIWREIVECTIVQPGGQEIPALLPLASTNKLLRDITVPILFRSLKFQNKAFYTDEVFNASLARLIWTYHRACSMYHAPHLLQHVRKIFLDQWTLNAFGGMGTDIDNMLTAIYDCLIILIGRMPRLQHLEVSSSPINPRLFHLLSSSPHIDRLSLSIGFSPVDIPPSPPLLNHVRHLQFNSHGNASPIDTYFHAVLEHSSHTLQSLEIPSAELARIITVASNHFLSLRTLIVNCNYKSPGVIKDVWNLLPLCPELRALTIDLFRTHQLPPILPPDIIPHLESLSIQTRLAPAFTAGRSVKNITIFDMNDIALDGIQQIVGECIALRELTLTITIHAYEELVEFIRSLNIYPNLVILQITSITRTMWIPVGSTRTPEELEAFRDALRQLRAVRVCDVTGHSLNRDPALIISPMGSIGNPDDRGHSSLEKVRAECIDEGWWAWYHAEGWQRMPDSYQSPYTDNF